VGEGFFSFVPSMFPPIPNMFPKGVPNSTSLSSHIFCPKSSPSHLYRWAKGGGPSSFNRIFYFGELSIVATSFCNGPIKITHCKNKSWTYEVPPTN
jgi:hypothetical protein